MQTMKILLVPLHPAETLIAKYSMIRQEMKKLMSQIFAFKLSKLALTQHWIPLVASSNRTGGTLVV